MPTPQTLTIITPPNQAPPGPSQWILLIGPHSSAQTPFYTVLHILATESGYRITVEQDDAAKLEIVDAAAASPEACLVVCGVPRGQEGYKVFGAVEFALDSVEGLELERGDGNGDGNGEGCLWVEVFQSVLVEWGWIGERGQ